MYGSANTYGAMGTGVLTFIWWCQTKGCLTHTHLKMRCLRDFFYVGSPQQPGAWQDPELLERIVETYPLGSTVQVQIEDCRASKKSGTCEMQSKPALARMCLKIWNGDFLSFAPFKGLQIEHTSIVLFHALSHPHRCWHNIEQSCSTAVGSILGPCVALVTLGGKWWTSQSGKLRGWHCGPTRLAFTAPWHLQCHRAGGTSAAHGMMWATANLID